MEAESQQVLNTIAEHDFQDAFKEMTGALVTVHTREREPKLVFGWQYQSRKLWMAGCITTTTTTIATTTTTATTTITATTTTYCHHHHCCCCYYYYYYYYSSYYMRLDSRTDILD
jgi:hypothetical protein